MSKEFFEKNPDADPNRFVFRNGKVWFKIDPTNDVRLVDIEYRSFYDSSRWTRFLTSYKDRGFGIWLANETIQPFRKNTSGEDTNNFPVHVTDEKYFDSNLPKIGVTNSSSSDYKSNPYLAAIFAAYVSTYVCGISTRHMTFVDKTPSVITSMVRYHLYYQISKFLRDPKKLDMYTTSVPQVIRKYKPTNDVWTKDYHQGREEINTWFNEQRDKHKIRNYRYSKNDRGMVTGITYERITGQSPKDAEDYKMFVATETDGLTKIGQKLLQQSVESYIYSVLGAQAIIRFSIVGEGAKSMQTQDKFRTIVKETIVQDDVAITISDMRTAIANTNVVLNMAISPGMILIPSNLIIQKVKIPGYNNVLTLATEKMKFGENKGVNYYKETTKKENEIRVVGKKEVAVVTPSPVPTPTTVDFVKKPSLPKVSVAYEVLGSVSVIVGFIISKFVL